MVLSTKAKDKAFDLWQELELNCASVQGKILHTAAHKVIIPLILYQSYRWRNTKKRTLYIPDILS